MKRTFEIELDVPADFDATYNPPYVLGSGCVITNGVLAWNVYADAKTPEPQWVTATASDEGKRARFRNSHGHTWDEGKLLHVDSLGGGYFLVLPSSESTAEWFNFCEVQV